ncbi:MAG: dihydroorotate dehydrogenase electron transfer subunit [Chlorobi bacterium]|nr:dihydroorotate dehydrogenase electron transfer subunit [Chlorobiota bacterium]
MNKFQREVAITRNEPVARDTYALRVHFPELSAIVEPGQFVTMRVNDTLNPLLRRPYSVSRPIGDECEFLYYVIGKGTRILARKRVGDTVNILGPLGNSFGFNGDYETAVLVGGGIGVAPFPFLTSRLVDHGKKVVTFLGARTAEMVLSDNLVNLQVATDDGTAGFHGTVVDCMDDWFGAHSVAKPKIFSCGPTPMLAAVQSWSLGRGIPCELSLESEMACGFGICQGCPVEHRHAERTYALVCTDGPCFNAEDITFKRP